MPTAKQSAASRANAQKSTGPRTVEGKAASRFNPLKHGIDAQSLVIPGESAEDLAELAGEFHDRYRPADPNERFLVDTLINNEWRIRRLRRVEAGLWLVPANAGQRMNTEIQVIAPSDPFNRLQRLINACERNYHRALKELQRRAATRDAQQSQPAAEAPQPVAPPVGQSVSSAAPACGQPSSPSSASFRDNPPAPAAAPETPEIQQNSGSQPALTPILPQDPASLGIAQAA